MVGPKVQRLHAGCLPQAMATIPNRDTLLQIWVTTLNANRVGTWTEQLARRCLGLAELDFFLRTFDRSNLAPMSCKETFAYPTARPASTREGMM